MNEKRLRQLPPIRVGDDEYTAIMARADRVLQGLPTGLTRTDILRNVLSAWAASSAPTDISPDTFNALQRDAMQCTK